MQTTRAGLRSWRGAASAAALLAVAVTSSQPSSAEPRQLASATGSAPGRYRTIDLGTLGGQSSVAAALNDRGAVVGRAQTADGTWHGFVWRHGTMKDLGLFSPTDINNRGEIVGTRDDAGGVYRWSHGTLTALGGRLRHAYAINDRGQVLASRGGDGGADVRVLWTRGTVRELPLDDVSDLNNRGQVAGGRITTTGFHASVWHRDKVTDLGAGAFDRSNAYRINESGWVIGWTFDAQQYQRGALWRHGRRTDLGTLGGNITRVAAINDRGVVLATSQVADGNLHPALWKRGKLTDLTAAGVSADGDFVDLNNRGEIAASIRPEFGTAHAIVYRPRR